MVTKVLVIDDSALMRQLISATLSSVPDIEVVGTAGDPYKAREQILAHDPDVLTLDVEMPRMDGLTFLGKLMRSRPMPVVMISSLTEKGCETTLQALELGAVDYVTKPKLDCANGMAELDTEIIDKVRAASQARVARLTTPATHAVPQSAPRESLASSTHKVLAIGTSTGGTQALSRIIPQFPPDTPGIVIVIHMPPSFTASYAKRLDNISQMTVQEATEGAAILPGRVLIAPGGRHLEVGRNGARYVASITDAAPVNKFRPSVDVLFQSCARFVGRNSIGIILTGMGNDGAEGLVAMKQSGATTIAQDEASSVVFGMPRRAIELGGAEKVFALDQIPAKVLSELRTQTCPV